MGYSTDQDSDILSSLESGSDKPITTTEEKKFKCTYPDCHAAYPRIGKLERHIRLHTGERPYACTHPGCTKSYRSSCHLKRHIKSHDPIKSCYKCNHCSKIFSNIDSLRSHYKQQHDQRKISCKECGENFKKKYRLVKHQTIHSVPTVPIGIDCIEQVTMYKTRYKCDKCPKRFINNTRLNRHKKTHEKSYSCPVSGCSEVFDKWSLLRQHKAKHKTEHKCDKCNIVLRTKRQLKIHSKTHSENRPIISCPYETCSRTYFYKSNLDHHIRMKHLDHKFCCDICSAELSSKQKLIEHTKRLHESSEKDDKKLKKRKKRKDSGMPRKSIIRKLIGHNLPPDINAALLEREATMNLPVSFDKSVKTNEQVESVENVS
ncbi:zinc finger protein 501-like [Harpegnathos saltator]|uniref:zinc finger protein 501-like n=1 Tax=Harpegnathos saltator TaxID=610380 RepID=UPI00058B0856|nr:zinc finger protein 501-like [Harpegnathos saltator]